MQMFFFQRTYFHVLCRIQKIVYKTEDRLQGVYSYLHGFSPTDTHKVLGYVNDY